MRSPEIHRKSNDYYIDEYDRDTIAVLKKIETEMVAAEKLFHIDPDDLKSPETNTEYLGHRIRYLDTGVAYARNKRFAVEERMQADERKDRMIKSQVIPQNIYCPVCRGDMSFEFYDFLEKDTQLLMWFSCPQGHIPRRAFYANGKAFDIPMRKCSYCGGPVSSTKRKAKHKLIFNETCRVCKKKTVMEFDVSPKKILPIDEAERKKYCTDFIGRRNFEEDVKALAGLSDIFEQEKEKEKYEFKNITQMNIAQLEQTLTAAIEKSDFIKVQFDKPKISRYLTLEFSVQDPTDRGEVKSIKALKKLVETVLFTTNWRLMSPGLEYRLGFLSGQLKGFSLEEDLLKIAREVWQKKS